MTTRFSPPFNPLAYGWLLVEPDLYLRLTPRGCVTIERDGWGWTVAVRRRDEDAYAIARGLFMSEALRVGGRAVGYDRSHEHYPYPRPWRDEAPTQKQLKTLRTLGYTGQRPATKGEAWDLIGAYALARLPIERDGLWPRRMIEAAPMTFMS